MRDHVYECEELIVGGSANAFMYAFLNLKPIVFTSVSKPYFFDEDDGVDWGKLVFALSLSGLIPCSSGVTNLRVEEGNALKAITQNSRLIKFRFDKLRVFDDQGVEGLPVPVREEQQYRVLDWINVKSGMTHEHDVLKSTDDFVKELYFYPSSRDGMSEDKKDAVAISFLDKKQLSKFEYSDTYARFKVLDMMKKAGIRGARNGRDSRNPEKYKYYALKAETAHREIQKVKMDLYNDTESIIFDYQNYKAGTTEDKTYLAKVNSLLSVGI